MRGVGGGGGWGGWGGVGGGLGGWGGRDGGAETGEHFAQIIFSIFFFRHC